MEINHAGGISRYLLYEVRNKYELNMEYVKEDEGGGGELYGGDSDMYT